MATNETYSADEKEKIRISAQETANTFTDEIFLSQETTKFAIFLEKFKSLSL